MDKDTVGTLWDDSVKRFKEENNVDIKNLLNLDDELKFEKAGDGSEKAKQLFQDARHLKNDKKSRIIESVGGCLDWMSVASGFIKDHASGTVSRYENSIGFLHC